MRGLFLSKSLSSGLVADESECEKLLMTPLAEFSKSTKAKIIKLIRLSLMEKFNLPELVFKFGKSVMYIYTEQGLLIATLVYSPYYTPSGLISTMTCNGNIHSTITEAAQCINEVLDILNEYSSIIELTDDYNSFSNKLKIPTTLLHQLKSEKRMESFKTVIVLASRYDDRFIQWYNKFYNDWHYPVYNIKHRFIVCNGKIYCMFSDRYIDLDTNTKVSDQCILSKLSAKSNLFTK